MKTIGIRAAPKVVTFAIFDAAERRIINIEELKIPAAFSAPDGLKYIRSNLLDILREFKVVKAGIRVTESNAQSFSIERIQIEGVIQEAFASSDLEAYYIGQISSISARIGIRREAFKPLVNGEESFMDGWSKLAKEEREAVLCAVGAIHA
jgi:hypothetical protein